MATQKELEKKQLEFRKKYQVIQTLIFDWKEVNEDVMNEIKNVITKLGGYMYSDPSTEGSDVYGYIISKKPITRQGLKYWAKLDNDIMDAD